jgi:hypothetical protein
VYTRRESRMHIMGKVYKRVMHKIKEACLDKPMDLESYKGETLEKTNRENTNNLA